MKATGIVRKTDPLGRIVLPAELRETMNINNGTPLEIFVDVNEIHLKIYHPACIYCGEADGVKLFRGKYICPACIEEIKML